MSLWVTLEPLSATVEAGDSAVVDLRIRNTGAIVEEYHVDVVGDPAAWCVVEPSAIRLMPGTTGAVTLTFSPPRAAESAAGPHVYGVRVAALEDADAVSVPEGTLTVAPFADVRAELVPPAVRGWRRGRPRLVVSNYGNTLATASVTASGSGNRVDFDVRTPSLQVQPGRAHFSTLRLRPERLLWFGQKVEHPYTATLQVSGRQPVTAAGTYQQTALLPRWLGRLVAGLATLAMVFAGLWLAIRPSVASDATALAAAGGPTVADSSAATLPPPSSASPPVVASSSATPPASAQSPAGPPAGQSSSGGAVAKPSKSPAAKPSTPPPPAPVVVPPPVGNWILNQTVGNTAVDSTNAHPGTASNGWWAGGSCLFNGSNSQIVTNGPVLNTGPGASFTVLADVFLASTTSVVEQTMVSQDGVQDSGFYLQYMGNGASGIPGVWAFSRLGSDVPQPAVARAYSTAPAKFGVWTRLAGVYDATDGQMQLYVNGQLQGTATEPTPYPTGGPLAMGRAFYDGKTTDWFHGALSNVEVFDQALTAAQIATIPVSH